jgi:hypothetical protein
MFSLEEIYRRFKGVMVAMMLQALSISESFVDFYEVTRHNITEDSHLQTCHHENLKSRTT